MSKNIKISNIDSDKLINGEMNEKGIKIGNEFINFNDNYDCVYATVEVDETNTIVKPDVKPEDWNQEDWDDWDKTLPLNIYVRKNGITTKINRLVTPKYPDIYKDRPIDNMFPFNKIQRVSKLNWRNFCNEEYIEEDDFQYKCLNQIYHDYMNDSTQERVLSVYPYSESAIIGITEASDNSIKITKCLILYYNSSTSDISSITIENPILFKRNEFSFYFMLNKDVFTQINNVGISGIIFSVDSDSILEWDSSSTGQKIFLDENNSPYSIPFCFEFSRIDDLSAQDVMNKFVFKPVSGYDVSNIIDYFSLEQLHGINDSIDDTRIDNKLFVKIPKYYNRTSFYKTNLGGYERKYEIISPETYNSLDDKEGFFIPIAFKNKDTDVYDNNLFISAFPESDCNVTNFFGGELNYINADLLPFNDNSIFTKPFMMNAETWFGVVCYLFRIYTGYMNPTHTIENYETLELDELELSDQSEIDDTYNDVYLTYYDIFNVETVGNNSIQTLLNEDGSLSFSKDKFFIAKHCERFTTESTPTEGGTANVNRLVIRNKSYGVGYEFDIPKSKIPNFSYNHNNFEYFITNLCFDGSQSNVGFFLPHNLMDQPLFDIFDGRYNIRIEYLRTESDVVVFSLDTNLSVTNVEFELKTMSKVTQDSLSKYINGRTLKFMLHSGYLVPSFETATTIVAKLDENFKSLPDFWYAINNNKVITDKTYFVELFKQYKSYPSLNASWYLTSFTHDTNDFLGAIVDSKSDFVLNQKNIKYKNEFSLLWFSNIFSRITYDYTCLDKFRIKRRSLRGYPSVNTPNYYPDSHTEYFSWYTPMKRKYKTTGIFIENLNMGFFNGSHSIGTPTDGSGYIDFTINNVSCGYISGIDLNPCHNDFGEKIRMYKFSITKFVCDDINILNKISDNQYYYTRDYSFFELPISITNTSGNKNSSFIVDSEQTDYHHNYANVNNNNICSIGSLQNYKYESSEYKPNNNLFFDLYSINVIISDGIVHATPEEPIFKKPNNESKAFCSDQNIFICFTEK